MQYKEPQTIEGCWTPLYVNEIRQLRYNPSDTLFYNLTYEENNWKELPYNIRLTRTKAPQMYDAPIKITFAKWSNLQPIKTTTPKECHYFYDNLEQHPKESKPSKKNIIIFIKNIYF